MARVTAKAAARRDTVCRAIDEIVTLRTAIEKLRDERQVLERIVTSQRGGGLTR
jgi:hypothetical protein